MSNVPPDNRYPVEVPRSVGLIPSSAQFNAARQAIKNLTPGVQPGRQIVQPPAGGAGLAFFHAKTTTQTTGQTLTADIYEDGPTLAATQTGVSVYCPMLSTTAVVATSVWFLASFQNNAWNGSIGVYSAEPV